MADSGAHLSEKAKQLLTATDAERIRAIQTGTWIAYPTVTAILTRLETLLAYPPVVRMPNMLLIGVSNNGKSSLLTHFHSKHPTTLNPEEEATVAPIVRIDAPSRPNTTDFYNRILQALMAPYRPSAPEPEKCYQAKVLFKTLGVRMLIIDDIQHLIAGSTNKQREFRNALKTLGNETQVTIVGAGTEDALTAFNTDPQLSNRFKPALLPLWTLDNEFGSLLATLERRTPLKKASNLVEPNMAQKILAMSEGILGEICDLLKQVAETAILNGDERITEKLLNATDWTLPSKRKQKPKMY